MRVNNQWPLVRLAEVCEVKTGTRKPEEHPDSPFVYIDISAVDNNNKRIVSPQHLLGKHAPSRARNVVRTNDVIVSTTRPNLNAVAYIPNEFDNQICSTGFCVLRPKPAELSPAFLFAFVQSGAFVEPLADLVKGALYPAVNDSQVLSQKIPLPPVDEQKRIATNLTLAMATVEKARRAAEERLAAAEALPAAYLREVFEGEEAEGWESVRLGNVLKRHNEIVHPGDKNEGESIFVGLEHIEANTGRRIGSSKIDFANMTGRKPTFRKSQIVYGYLRPYLNKVWIADFDGCSSVDQFAFNVQTDLADVSFIAAFLRSNTFLQRSKAVTTTGQLPRISIDEIVAVTVEIPPLTEQKRIAAEVSERLSKAETLIAHCRTELQALEALPAALLREVFGEAGE